MPPKPMFFFPPPPPPPPPSPFWQGTNLPPSPFLNDYFKVLIEEWRGRRIRDNLLTWLALFNWFIVIVYETNYLRMCGVNFVENNHPFLNILSHMVPHWVIISEKHISYNCICNLKFSDLKIRKRKLQLRKF